MWRRLVIVAVALAVGAMASGMSDYGRLIVATVAFNAIAVLAISVLAGSAGIWSLGHTAFIALGGYLAANLAGMNIAIEVIVPLVVAVAAILGYFLGLSAGRFSILYFGLLTMAVALTGVEIIGRLTQLTGGDQGMPAPPMPSWTLHRSLESRDAMWTALLLAAIVFVIADYFVKGAAGRRWRAVKSHRLASMSLGLVPHRENAAAFAISAAVAAVAGVAGALTIGFLEPETYSLDAGVMLIAATVVGGIASFWGAVLGAAFIVAVPELARGLRDVSAFGMGLAMMAVLLFLPRGIVPSVLAAGGWRRPASGGPVATAGAHKRIVDEATAGKIAALATELMPRSDKSLVVEGLSVQFGGLKALDEVAIHVPAGATVGLIGPNGAGKTTLLNALSGYVKPSTCKLMRLGDAELSDVAPYARLRLGFGRTFQHAELFGELTIREMLVLAATMGHRNATGAGGSDSAPTEIAEKIIDGLALGEVADRFPEELPFGIQKVADIGRILASRPHLVALDEPFSGLDSNETNELRAILLGMKSAGVSILIIDHAVKEVLNIADRVVVFDFGQVIAEGTPREIQDHAEVQRAYFGTAAAASSAQIAAGTETIDD